MTVPSASTPNHINVFRILVLPNQMQSSASLGALGMAALLVKHHPAPDRRRIEATRRNPLKCIEHEVGRSHLCQPAVGSLCAGKATVLGELVDRLAPAAYRKILAPFAAHRHTSVYIGQHPSQGRAIKQIDQLITIDVAQNKIVIS